MIDGAQLHHLPRAIAADKASATSAWLRSTRV